MSKLKLLDFQQAPDMGDLKRQVAEYQFLQNIRGWGGLGSKRRGTFFSTSFDSGVMGIFDLKIDNDPGSMDKILIVTGDGSFNLFDITELVTIFDYLFASGIGFALQSPDLNWWSVIPNSDGELVATVISTPSSTITSDLNILNSQSLGFSVSGNVYRLRVQSATGDLFMTSYSTALAVTNYSSNQAFVTGVGPVFEADDLTRFRLTINNSGSLVTTAL